MEGRCWRSGSTTRCKCFYKSCIRFVLDKGKSKLLEKTGIITFINIGRKEHPSKKDISIQA